MYLAASVPPALFDRVRFQVVLGVALGQGGVVAERHRVPGPADHAVERQGAEVGPDPRLVLAVRAVALIVAADLGQPADPEIADLPGDT